MRSGTLPSPGRRIVLNGRVGASRRSICMPVMTFLNVAEAVLRLEVGGEELEAGGHDDRADLDLEHCVRACRGRCASAGQAATHSPALGADAAVQAAARAARGLRLGHAAARPRRSRAAPREHGAFGVDRIAMRYVFWRARTCGLVDDGEPHVEAVEAAELATLSQRSIMCAARRPWPTARRDVRGAR